MLYIDSLTDRLPTLVEPYLTYHPGGPMSHDPGEAGEVPVTIPVKEFQGSRSTFHSIMQRKNHRALVQKEL